MGEACWMSQFACISVVNELAISSHDCQTSLRSEIIQYLEILLAAWAT